MVDLEGHYAIDVLSTRWLIRSIGSWYLYWLLSRRRVGVSPAQLTMRSISDGDHAPHSRQVGHARSCLHGLPHECEHQYARCLPRSQPVKSCWSSAIRREDARESFREKSRPVRHGPSLAIHQNLLIATITVNASGANTVSQPRSGLGASDSRDNSFLHPMNRCWGSADHSNELMDQGRNKRPFPRESR